MNNTRFLNELKKIHSLSKKFKLIILNKDPNNFIVKFKIPRTSPNDLFVKIIFPSNYPFITPEIWFYDDPDLQILSDYQWTTHQNSDGSMCLFTGDFGPGSWYYKKSITNIINKIQNFLEKCQNKTITDDHTSIFHPLPGRLEKSFVYLPLSILNEINASQSIIDELLLYEFIDNRPSFVLNTIQNPGLFQNPPWNLINTSQPIGKGIYLKLSFTMTDFRKIIIPSINPEEIFKNLNPELNNIISYDFILPIFTDTSISTSKIISPSEFRTHISYLYSIKKTQYENINHIPFHQVFGVNLHNDIFQRTFGILKQNIDVINQKKVMLIGLGTLGSFISLELAKTGISHFILIDYDKIQPVNICRHIAFINDIGKFKTEVIKEQILQTNPKATVKHLNINPFTTANIMDFKRKIKNTDLIVMSTANHNASILLNKIAIDEKKTVIYSVCGPDAKSGRIFRVFPNRSPCYICINSQLLSQDNFFYRIKPTNDKFTIQFAGYNQPGIPGISIDINFIALFTARLAIQTLLSENEAELQSECNHYIWQNYKTGINPYRDIDLIPQGEFSKMFDCEFCGAKNRFQNRSNSRQTQTRINNLKKVLSSRKRKSEF